MKLLRSTLALLVLLVTLPACAATLTWVAPTDNDDGSTPPLIGGYNVYVANTDAALTALPNTIPGPTNPNPSNVNSPWVTSVGNVLTWTTPPLAPGTYFWAVTTWWCPTNGQSCQESVQGAHVSLTITASIVRPNPPGGLGARK